MAIIKNKNFFVVQGWMVNNLKLKGNELIIYAIIYGFSQDEEQWFEGSRSYLAGWCNSTKMGIQKNLNRLVESQLILKKEVFNNNVKFCRYKVNPKFTPGDPKDTPREQSSPGGKQSLPVVNKVYQGGKQSLLGGGKQSLPGGGKQSLPNNIELDNIDINNIDNIYDHFCENDRVSDLAEQGMKAIKETTVSSCRGNDKTKRNSVSNGIVVSKSESKEVIKEENSNSAASNKKAPRVTEKQLKNEFESLWALYPRKQGKKAAEASFIRARKRGIESDTIASGIKAYVNYIQAKKISQEYIKQGSTFFNQNAWDDDYTVSEPSFNNAKKEKSTNVFDELYEESKNQEKFIDYEVNDHE